MKIVPNIFKIDKLHRDIAGLPDTEAIIRRMISHSYKKKNRSFNSENLKLNSFKKEDFEYFLYMYRAENLESDWSNFLPEELKDNAIFSQTKVNLIIFIETEEELFAIVGGSAYWIIASFIDHLFGLLTYDRLISLEHDEAISTKSRGMTGQRVGVNEQFRDDYRIINYLQFGKVPKELHIKLASDTSVLHFRFLLNKPLEKLQIAAGKAFKINKEVDFASLHKIIKELSVIVTMAPKDFISSYIQVSDSKYIKLLNEELNRKIYNNIGYVVNHNNDPRDIFEFDFCNPNKIEEFYEAERYELVEKTETGKKKDGHFATVTDKSEIYKTVITRAYEVKGNNELGVFFYLYGVSVQCYVGKKQTASSGFMYHFNAEFSIKNESIFLVDSKWYRLKESFIDSLKSQTERILRNSKLTVGILHHPWTFDTVRMKFSEEGKYNLLYDKLINYIVLDTIIVDGVELCDILYITPTELYLIHVKHSFTSRVRELTNQILISARRLREAIASKQRTFFDKLYDSLLIKKRSTTGLNKDDFYTLFLLRKPIYVFATASQLVNDLIIEDNMDNYDSNIARFSLTTCSGEMQTNYYELRTFQIVRAYP